MVYLKKAVLKNSLKWHKWMGWTGGLALLIFALSGILHPVMIWTGPKAAAFFPPQVSITASHAAAIPQILHRHGIDEAIMVKVTPSADGAILQVTEHNDRPRRYFDLNTGDERPGFDKQQAVWLARYYTGHSDATIKEISFQTEFDAAYPWVNRLLPVYRVRFDTDDTPTAFIYTELGALANLTNDWRTSAQSLFRILHTWTWLQDSEPARVIVMMVMLLSLFAMAATGTAMIFLMKNRRMGWKAKIHRLIAYIVWLPLLLFSFSGMYHLLQYAYGDNHRGLQLGQPIVVTPDRFGTIADGNTDWLDLYRNVTFNGLSLVENPDGDGLLYRLGIPQGRPGHKVTQALRFDGVPIEKPALYFDAKTGQEAAISDRDMALFHARQHSDLKDADIIGSTLVTHFGPLYDFRNKRLPVWRIDYATDDGDKLFIDPATGMLVDRLVDSQRYEGYSFSFLHKWNFLNPLTGRTTRDILIIITLSFAVFATIIGFVMLLKPRKPKRRRSNYSNL